MGVSGSGDYDLSLLFSIDRVLRGVVEDTKTGRFGAVKRPYMVKWVRNGSFGALIWPDACG